MTPHEPTSSGDATAGESESAPRARAAALSQYARLDDGRLGLRTFRSGAPRVVCFPFAGGQSLAFRPLADQLPASWGISAIDPPGHGWCGGEPLACIDAMVECYSSFLTRERLDGAVWLGHSLGGCVAYALAEHALRRGWKPAAMVLSGTRPPHRRDDYDSFLSMDDATLLKTLIQFGGIPAQFGDEPELFEHFKPALRADFQAFETFEINSPLTGIPILAVGGLDDLVCRPDHLLEWSRFCPGCQIDFVPGGHMYLQTHARELAERLTRFVEEIARN